MLAPCFMSPFMHSHSVFGSWSRCEVLVRMPEESRAQMAACGAESTLFKMAGQAGDRGLGCTLKTLPFPVTGHKYTHSRLLDGREGR